MTHPQREHNTDIPFLPYGRQAVDDDDRRAVWEVLTSDWLTTGPKVDEFERAWAEFCGRRDAVAVSSGTAALHVAAAALGLGPGDEAIVTPLTFVASVNCLLYVGAKPVFADVDPGTLLMDPRRVAELMQMHGDRIKAIIPVDYAGQPCDYDAIRGAAPGVPIIADACHSPGARDKGRKAGTLADMACFSFHPVKHLTTAEGGAIAVDSPELAARMRVFRNHGIDSDHRSRANAGSWFYDMQSLGFNYRLTDLQCALGLSQLGKLAVWLERRKYLAKLYTELLAEIVGVEPLAVRAEADPAWHLYVVRIRPEFGKDRDRVFDELRRRNIGANVHYRPVHTHSYYRKNLGFREGLCPVAEAAANEILTLPLWPGMDDDDVRRVADALLRIRG